MASRSRFLRQRDRFWDFLLSRPTAAISTTPPTRLQLLPLEERITPDSRPLPYPYIFVGAESGAPPMVRAFKADTGEVAFEKTPFEQAFTGGVRVGAGDLNNDGFPDLIAAAGPGGGPRVRVYDGKTGETLSGPLGDLFAFQTNFTGGVYVSAGDVDGDGWSDLIMAAGVGGGPHIRALSGRTGAELASFFAFAPDFTGGATVMAADFTGDGKAELAVGAGPGGGPHVKTFNLSTRKVIDGPLGSFFAFDPSFRGGVEVGTDYLAGDVTGDKRADLIVGAGPGNESASQSL